MTLQTLKQFSRRQPHWALALTIIFVLTFYWSVLATERYVSAAYVVVDTPQVSMEGMNLGSLLTGGAPGSADLLLLREHLLSVDMLQKMQKQLDLRQHFSEHGIDRFARMAGEDLPMEQFHRYMQNRIEVELDDYSGVLRVTAQAYDPDMAQRMTEVMLAEGEAHMNAMGQRLAREQMEFIKEQADENEQRLFAARDRLLEFQNEHGLVSPTGTVEAIFTTVAELEAQLAVLKARDRALSRHQSDQSGERFRLRSEINSLEEQVAEEREKMARLEGDALNHLSAEFETLQMRAEFALELYSQTLAALENTRVEAARTLKQISVLQEPTAPQYPKEPRRLYNITVVWVFGIFLAAILHLVRAIVRDHKD